MIYKRLLFLSLFLFSLFLSSLHELNEAHHSESCQVCLVADVYESSDFVTPSLHVKVLSYFEAFADRKTTHTLFTCKTSQARAPPFNS